MTAPMSPAEAAAARADWNRYLAWRAKQPDPSGGTAGGTRVIKCPFAYNTPNLLTGATVYTPTIGDILLDAWIEIDTAWDGTTPLGDFGPFTSTAGLFHALLNDAVPMDYNDRDIVAGLLAGNCLRSLSLASSILNAKQMLTVSNEVFGFHTLDYGAFGLPFKFASADPIKVVVSQDGENNGADPGSTQGAAILYLVVVTPSAA